MKECYLVSDDNKDGTTNANVGVTLPEGLNATHNTSLSPLFLNRAGDTEIWPNTAMWHGSSGLFSSKTACAERGAYYFQYEQAKVIPSNYWNSDRVSAWSLRCLVSTNNG